MNDTKFKALTHAGQYVDAVLLIKGIYTCDIPRLYPHTETIEHMIEEAEKAVPWIWHKESLKTYIENLRKCQLADVLVVQAGGAFSGSAQYLPLLDDDKQETPVTTPTKEVINLAGEIIINADEMAQLQKERLPFKPASLDAPGSPLLCDIQHKPWCTGVGVRMIQMKSSSGGSVYNGQIKHACAACRKGILNGQFKFV